MHIGEEKSINIKYHVDDLLRMTGGFGRYQLTLFAFIWFNFPPALSFPSQYSMQSRLLLFYK